MINLFKIPLLICRGFFHPVFQYLKACKFTLVEELKFFVNMVRNTHGIDHFCTPQICAKRSSHLLLFILYTPNSIITSIFLLKYVGIQQSMDFCTPRICGVIPPDSRLASWEPNLEIVSLLYAGVSVAYKHFRSHTGIGMGNTNFFVLTFIGYTAPALCPSLCLSLTFS